MQNEEFLKEYCTIYIVRHGQTDWNVLKRIQGHSDIPLNKEGEAQARALASMLKDIHFDKIISSDLVRAKRTAEIVALERQMEVETMRMLREQHFGRHEGTSGEEFFKLFTRWNELSEEEKGHYKVSEDMESNEQAVTRLLTVLRELGTAYKGKTLLIVAHGALMRYLLIKLGKATYEKPLFFGNTGHIKLRTDGLTFFVDEIEGTEEQKVKIS